MKYLVVALISLACLASSNAASTYDDKYDKIDLDAIIQNERLFKNYVNCLLDKGTCRPEGAELKGILPEALKNECEKCTQAQKVGSRKILHHLINNKREDFDELEKKYDPKRIYFTKYTEGLKKEGISL